MWRFVLDICVWIVVEHLCVGLFKDVFGGGGGGGGFGSIFDDFFGGSGGGTASEGSHGADLRVSVKITLEQAAKGVEKEIKYHHHGECVKCDGSGASSGSGKVMCSTCGGIGKVASNQGFISIRRTCPSCSGTGVMIEKPCQACKGEGRVRKQGKVKVKVPPGVSHGNRLCSRGRGDAGARGGQAGDLYVDVLIEDHPLFERDEDDLFHDIQIPFALAALGGTIEVPTLDGKVSLKVPAGTQSNKTFRLRDHGMPNLRYASRKGDLYVKIAIEVPKKLSKEQKDSLINFAKSCGEKNYSEDDGFLNKAKKFFENE